MGEENTGVDSEGVTAESVINGAESEKGQREEGCSRGFVTLPEMDN